MKNKKGYPTTTDPQWVSVTFEPVESLNTPITLSKIKENANLQNIALIRQPRLAVMHLLKEEFEGIFSEGSNIQIQISGELRIY
jgi:predicted RNA-binding protein with PUA-like domain